MLALLYAPKTGEETQRELKEGARRLRQGAEEKLAELKDSAEETYGAGSRGRRRAARDRERRASGPEAAGGRGHEGRSRYREEDAG